MRPSDVQTSVVLQQTLTCLKDMGVSVYTRECIFDSLTIALIIGNMAKRISGLGARRGC